MTKNVPELPPAATHSRYPVLDLARAWAVTAMVIGHTLEATMLVSERARPFVAQYWQLRGLTAPLFLVVSGWAVALLFCRRPLGQLGHLRDRWPRILALVGLGLALRFPNWAIDGLLAGKPEILAHFFALDVLQAIGCFLFLGCLLFGLSTNPLVRGFLAATLAVLVAAATPAIWTASAHWSLAPRLILGGTTSPFPLFPWWSYFLVGMSLGAFSSRGAKVGIRSWRLVAGGCLLIALGFWFGIGLLPAVPNFTPGLVSKRLGLVLVGIGLLGWVPAQWSQHLRILGRHTLAIYFIHLVVVYGGLDLRGLGYWVGRTLPLSASLALGLTLLAGSIGLAWFLGVVRRLIRRLLIARITK